MRGRLEILDEHGFKLSDIQDVIGAMKPLPGAREFLDELRDRSQVIILSDTFYQFATPFMRQLGQPTLFCHELLTDEADRVTDYRLRIPDGKRQAVAALQSIGFRVHAAGDSYNDTTMLEEADRGVLFRCPDNVAEEFPQFQRTDAYGELLPALLD
jgi:phosphoserine/homoserine phosphotransferase